MRLQSIPAFLSILIAFVIGTPGATAQIPPGGAFAGRTYTQWEVLWWQTALSIPVEDGDHVLISGGPFAGPDNMLFLSGIPGAAGTIDMTISRNTALFFPIVNAECSVLEPDPFHGDDETSLRACANGHIDSVTGLFATVDGDPVDDLSAFRIESPLFVFGPLPEDNVFAFFGLDAPAGTTSASVDAGYYLLFSPLSPGMHEIHFGATVESLDFFIDTRYLINVVPEPTALALLGLVLGALCFACLRFSSSLRSITVAGMTNVRHSGPQSGTGTQRSRSEAAKNPE